MLGRGLSKVPSSDLEGLMRAIYKGRVEFPLRRETLMMMGMNRLAEQADVLLGLDEKATRAVLVAVLAERRKPA